jgi:hypothetical protein
MTENTCLYQAAAANYSTDAGSGTGRSLTTGGSATSSTASQMAEWRWDPGTTRKVAAGTTYVSVLVSCPVVGATLTLNGAVGSVNANNGNFTSKGTGTASVSCTTANSWSRVDVAMTVGSQYNINSSNQLSVRVFVTGGTAGEQLRLDYEQPTSKSFFYAKVT